MGRGPSPRQGEIIVDERGRTSLARVRTRDYTRYLATEHENGTITLTPAITMTPAELAKLGAGPDQFLDNPHETGTRRQHPEAR